MVAHWAVSMAERTAVYLVDYLVDRLAKYLVESMEMKMADW